MTPQNVNPMVRPPSMHVKAVWGGFFGNSEATLTAPDPERLTDLSKRLDDLKTRHARGTHALPPGSAGIALRFGSELVAALFVGGGLGWGIDWLFGRFGLNTRPAFLIVFFVLGAAAGIRNVMRAAAEINAEIAQNAASKQDRTKGE